MKNKKRNRNILYLNRSKISLGKVTLSKSSFITTFSGKASLREIIFDKVNIIILTAALLFFVCLLFKETSDHVKGYEDAKGEIIVIFKDNIGDEDLSTLISSLNHRVELRRHIDNYALFYVNEENDYYPVLKALKGNTDILTAQANQSIELMEASNDPYYDTLWAINNPGYFMYYNEFGSQQKSATSGIDMDVAKAWDTLKQSSRKLREVIVAVVDTGVDYAHPDLAEHMWSNLNEIPDDGKDNDDNGYIDDIYGWDFYNNDSTVCHYQYSKEYDANLAQPEDNDDHGTHVAGIIGAVSNNGIGIAGVASNIDLQIMSLKINGDRNGKGDISDAIEAVKYATKMGADICNMSWGTYDYPEALYQIMKESDMLFVAAAGNSGTDNNTRPIYPAGFSLDNVLSVTFINPKGELSHLSNYGTTSIDLAAPGQDIYSTTVGNYAYMSGSSMAAPHVTAVAAMLYASSDYLYPANVREVIINTRKPLKSLEGYLKNPGIPSAYHAVLAYDSLLEDSMPPQLKLSTLYDKKEMIAAVNVSDQGDSNIRVLKWLRGNRRLEDFDRGMNGASINNNQLKVTNPGNYTFYTSDYAGNEILQSYEIKADKAPPQIDAYYTVTDDYKLRTIHLKIKDIQSGIEKVEYQKGIKTAVDFQSSKNTDKVTLKKGKGSIQVKEDGIYTIHAIDYQGNASIKQIDVKTVKATAIKLVVKKLNLNVGDTYFLTPYLKPVNTTDELTYSSSNKKIVSITKDGELKALKAGMVTITIKTSSGRKAVCEVIVRK